jgi:hypothetical protein
MTMSDFRTDDDMELDAVFAAGRRHAPQPSDDLLAKIEADALSEQAAFLDVPMQAPRRTGLQSLLPVFGGWLGLSGLAASVVIGIGIGVWQPVDFGIGTTQAGVDTQDEPYFFSFEDALAEG